MSSVADSLGGLAKSASIVFAGTIVGRAIALLAETLIVRSLTPATLGRFSLAYTVIVSVGSLVLLGVHEGVTRQLSADSALAEQHDVIRSGYLIVLFAGTVAAVVLFEFRNGLATALKAPYLASIVPLFLPYLLVYPLSRLAVGILRAKKQSLSAVLARDLGARAVAILVLLVLVTLGLSAEGAVVYWVGFPLITVLLATYFISHEWGVVDVVSGLPDQQTMRNLWSFSWPLAIGSLVFLLLSNMDILMIGYYLTPTKVGYYRSIQPLRQIATFVISSFTFLYLPLATEYYESGRMEELNRIYTVSTKWIVAATIPGVLFLSVFADDVINLLYGSNYLAAAPALSVLILGLSFRALTGLDGDMVKAINRPRIELYSGAVGVTVNFVANVVLIPRLGIIGAAIGTVVGYGIYNVVEVAWIYYLVRANPFSAKMVKQVVPTAILALVMSVVLPNHLGYVDLAVVGVVLFAVQPISTWITNSFHEEDLQIVEKIEQRFGRNLSFVTDRIEDRV